MFLHSIHRVHLCVVVILEERVIIISLCFGVLLTVHLSIILVISQLNAQILVL